APAQAPADSNKRPLPPDAGSAPAERQQVRPGPMDWQRLTTWQPPKRDCNSVKGLLLLNYGNSHPTVANTYRGDAEARRKTRRNSNSRSWARRRFGSQRSCHRSRSFTLLSPVFSASSSAPPRLRGESLAPVVKSLPLLP